MTVSSAAEIKTLVSSAPAWRSALKKLYVQVLIAVALGALLGAVYPSLAVDMKPFSDGFITLIRAVVPPIIFATVAVGIAKMGDIRRFLMKVIPSNLVGAVAQGNLLPVLVIAALFGFALCQMGERGQRLVSLIDDVMHALFGIVHIIMYVAPLAAFGAIAFTIGKFGFGILASLGQLVASIYLTSILFVLFGFGAIAWMFGLRPRPRARR